MHFPSTEDLMADPLFLSWYHDRKSSEARQWESWLAQHPEYAAMTNEAVAWLDALHLEEKAPSVAQTEAALKRLEQQLGSAPVVKLRSRTNYWWAAAAAVLLLVGGYFFWTNVSPQTKFDSAYGAISNYKLPDGSEVTLNANSHLTLNKSWKEGGDREVWLKGEAFFKVQKTAKKDRFIVHTQSMDIIVTGTQFNAVSRDDESSVLLTEGSVTIRTSDGREVHMKPGDFVRIENNKPEKAAADQQRILAWKAAKLDFEKTPIDEVARVIARHYGVKVNVDKSVGGQTVSGIMPNDSLDVLIAALEATGDYKIRKNDKEITISAP